MYLPFLGPSSATSPGSHKRTDGIEVDMTLQAQRINPSTRQPASQAAKMT